VLNSKKDLGDPNYNK